MKHNSKIFVDNGIIIYAGKVSKTQQHKHYAIQIGLVLNGSYRLFIEDKEYDRHNFIIHSNVPHRHVSKNGALFCILIDPTTDLGNALVKKYAPPYKPITICQDALRDLRYELSDRNQAGGQSIENLEFKIFKLLKLPPAKRTIDSRIAKLIEAMHDTPAVEIDLDTLINEIPLSKSRIRSLFKQQTGLSMQRYLLWVKIKHAFYHIMQNKSLSEAAFLAGFADYAHLSRVIHQISGMTMKSILKDSYFVQE